MGLTWANTGKWRELPSALQLPNGKKNRENKKNRRFPLAPSAYRWTTYQELKPSSFKSHLGCFIRVKRSLQLLQLLSFRHGGIFGHAAMCNLRVNQQAQEPPGDMAGGFRLPILRHRVVEQREILRAWVTHWVLHYCSVQSWDVGVQSRTILRLIGILGEPGKFQNFLSFLCWFRKNISFFFFSCHITIWRKEQLAGGEGGCKFFQICWNISLQYQHWRFNLKISKVLCNSIKL